MYLDSLIMCLYWHFEACFTKYQIDFQKDFSLQNCVAPMTENLVKHQTNEADISYGSIKRIQLFTTRTNNNSKSESSQVWKITLKTYIWVPYGQVSTIPAAF